ncbi:MAG: hypothetical protein GX556_10120 [Fibrobacter sp.]|nr:hypothetical protein [Fibrobacter sp.]
MASLKSLFKTPGTNRTLKFKWTKPEQTGKKTGLILIQIDGLSRSQLQKAISAGKMPFMQKLIRKKGYRLHSFYSGLPSSTPAVQAEIFYGVKCAVPSFGFIDRDSRAFFTMLSSRFAGRIQRELEGKGEGLLSGGSAYSDCFTGGAAKASFCATSVGFGSYWFLKHPFNVFFFIIRHWFMFLRLAVLLVIECGLAVIDLLRGIISRENFLSELNFLPTRVGICVLLRELIVAGVSVDCSRGVPVIHCNLLGYDEQSHRRGPSSRFAHWTLKGIDDSIRRICCASQRSKGRRYSLWIYSDHGQEHSVPYSKLFGKSVTQAVSEIINPGEAALQNPPHADTGIQFERVVYLGKQLLKHFRVKKRDSSHSAMITAVGPIGHIYLSSKDQYRKKELALALVLRAHIPAVIFTDDSKKVKVFTAEGLFRLPEDAVMVLGEGHPFSGETADDLITLIKNRFSGDLLILGWRARGDPISFPIENGAHAGPGREETHGFVLAPKDSPVGNTKKGYLRPIDLRNAALEIKHRTDYL